MPRHRQSHPSGVRTWANTLSARAFTLVEVVIAIVVLGILSGIAIAGQQAVVRRSNEASTKTASETLARQIESLAKAKASRAGAESDFTIQDESVFWEIMNAGDLPKGYTVAIEGKTTPVLLQRADGVAVTTTKDDLADAPKYFSMGKSNAASCVKLSEKEWEVIATTRSSFGACDQVLAAPIPLGAPDRMWAAVMDLNQTGDEFEDPANSPLTQVSQAPPAPTAVTGEARDGAAMVSWTDASYGTNRASSYEVEVFDATGATPTGVTGATTRSSVAKSLSFTGLANGTAYTFKVRAKNSVGDSAWSALSSPVTPAEAPGAPTNVQAQASSTQGAVSWSAPANATATGVSGYVVTLNGQQGCTTSTTTCAITGLQAGSSYSVVVAATAPGGNGAPSTALSLITLGVPSNVTAVPGAGSASLTWTAPASDGNSAITDYVVEYSDDDGSTWNDVADGTSPVTSAEVPGLSPGEHRFRVAAKNSVGAGAWSPPSTDVSIGNATSTPSAPTNVVATASGSAIAVSWQAPTSNGGSAVESYSVRWRRNGGSWSSPANATLLQRSYADMQPGSYEFQVNATNAVGTGAWSQTSDEAVVTTSPETPTTLDVTLASTQGTASWGALTGSTTRPLTGYRLFRDGVQVCQTATTSCSFNGLTAGTAYSFQVAAYGSAGQSELSAAVSRTAFTAPRNVTVVAGDSSVAVSWTAPQHLGGGTVAMYQVRWSSDAGATWSSPADVTGALTYTATGLTNGVTYSFAVRAKNEIGFSAWSSNADATPVGAPATPSGVQAIASSTEISTSWSALAASAAGPVTGYRVYVNSALACQTADASCFVTDRIADTTYTVELSAYGPGGESAKSTAVSITTMSAPTAVAASPSDASAQLTWASPVQTGGSSVLNYVVRYSSDNGSSWSTPTETGSTAMTHTVTGLANGTAYVFSVRAVNAVGYSAWSVVSDATTPVSVPDAPTSITVVASSTIGEVSWAAVASTSARPVTGYRVFRDGVQVCQVAVTTCSDAGLSAGVSYSYQVATYGAGGQGPSSAAAPVTSLGVPTAVAAESGDARATVSWAQPAGTGNSGITRYDVRYSIDGGVSWSAPVSTGSPTVSHIVTPLENHSEYVFSVRAVNGVGAGSWSSNTAPVRVLDPYGVEVMADAPVGFWRMRDAAGASTVKDRSGSGIDATVAGSVTLNQTGPGGALGTAARFNGGHLLISDDPRLRLSQTTIEAWVKLDAFNSGSWVNILTKNAYPNRNYSAWAYHDGSLFFSMGTANGYTDVVTQPGTLRTGVWYHIAASYDGHTGRVFVNGVERRSSVVGSPLQPGTGTAAMRIGADMDGGYTNSTHLAEVAVYNKALTPSRIAAHTTAAGFSTPNDPYARAVLATSPVYWWRLNESSGTALADAASVTGQSAGTLGGGALGAAGPLGNVPAQTSTLYSGSTGSSTNASDVWTNAQSMTMEAWVHPTGPQPSGGGTVTSSLQSDGTFRGHEIRLGSSGNVVVYAINSWSGNAIECQTAVGAVPTNTWSHIVASYAPSSYTLYVNGTPRPLSCTHNALSATTVSNQKIQIGQRPGGSWPFVGRIAEVAWYASALTEASARDHYDAATAPVSYSAYDTEVTADAPSARWKLDEQSGTTLSDSTANSRTATLAAGTARPAAPPLVFNGSSHTFDGSSYFTVDASKSQLTGPITVEAWIRPSQVVTQMAIVEKYDLAASGNGFALRVNGGGNVLFYVSNTSGGASVVSDRAIVANRTYHIVATANGSSIRVYINGALEGTTSTALTPTSGTASLKIGARGDDAATRFSGQIDEVATYSSALSETRIAAHYQTGSTSRDYQATVLTDSPTGYLRFAGTAETWNTGTAASGYTLADAQISGSADAGYEYITWLHSDNGTIMQQRFENGAPVGSVVNVGCCTPGAAPGAAAFSTSSAVGLRGGDNALYTRVTSDGTSSWSPAGGWENRGTDIRGSIVGTGSRLGLFMFARGNDSQTVFFQRWTGSWTSWSAVGCCITGEIAAGADGEGNLYIVGVNPDGAAWYRWSNDGATWQTTGWSQIIGGSNPDHTSRPALVTDPDGRLRVVQRFTDGSLRTITLSRNTVSAWSTIAAAGSASEVAGASYNDRTFIFKLLNGTVQSSEWDGATWSPWTTRLTGVSSRIAAAARGSLVVTGRGSGGANLLWASMTARVSSTSNPGESSTLNGALVGKASTTSGPLQGGQSSSALTGSFGSQDGAPYGGAFVPHSSYLNPSARGYTAESWVNLPLNSIDSWHGVLMKGKTCCNNNDEAYAMYVNNTGFVHHITNPNGVRQQCNTDAGTIPANTWTHIAVSYDGQTMATYINGKISKSCSFPGSVPTNSEPLTIGPRPRNASFGSMAHPLMGGRIAETAVFNYPLSADRIAEHYRARTRVVTTSGVAAPAAPTVSTADSSATVGWDAVTGATRYNVLRNGSYVGSTPGTTFVDSTAVNGAQYSYSIQAANATSVSSFSPSVTRTLWAAPHARLISTATGAHSQTPIGGFSTFASQGQITPSSTGVTVLEAGVYLISTQIHMDHLTNNHGWVTLSSEPSVRFGVWGNTGGNPSLRLMHQSVLRYLPANTVVQSYIWTANLAAEGSNPHILTVTRVDGGSASTPFAAMSSTHGNASPASGAVPGFAQEQVQGGVTTSGDGLTAPSDGIYLVAFDLNSHSNHGWLTPGHSSGCSRSNVYGNGSGYAYMSYLGVMRLSAGAKAQIFHWAGPLISNGVNRHRLSMVKIADDTSGSFALAESTISGGAGANLSGLNTRFGREVTLAGSSIMANRSGVHVFASGISSSRTAHGWLWTTRAGGSGGTRFGSTTELNHEDYGMLADAGYLSRGDQLGFYQYNGSLWSSTCNPHWLSMVRVPHG